MPIFTQVCQKCKTYPGPLEIERVFARLAEWMSISPISRTPSARVIEPDEQGTHIPRLPIRLRIAAVLDDESLTGPSGRTFGLGARGTDRWREGGAVVRPRKNFDRRECRITERFEGGWGAGGRARSSVPSQSVRMVVGRCL